MQFKKRMEIFKIFYGKLLVEKVNKRCENEYRIFNKNIINL